MTSGFHQIGAVAQTRSDDGEINLLSLLRAVFRGWMIVALCTLIGCALAYYIARITPPAFAASVSIQLQKGVDPAGGRLNPLAMLGGGGPSEKYVEAELRVLVSTRLAELVVDRLNLTEDPDYNPSLVPDEPGPLSGLLNGVRSLMRGDEDAAANDQPKRSDRQIAADILLLHVSTERIKQSHVIDINVQASSAEKAATLASTYAQAYIDSRAALKMEANAKSLAWLDERLPELKKEVEDKERQVADFRAKYGVANQAVSSAANDRLVDLLRARTLLDESRDMARQALAVSPQPPTDAESARAFLRVLGLNSAEGDPVAAAANAHAAQAALATNFEGDARRLDALIASQREGIEREAAKLAQLRQYEREVAAAARIYETFLGKLKELSQQAAIREDDARVVSDPLTPLRPVRPRTLLMLLMGLVGGGAIGAGIAAVRGLYFAPFQTSGELGQETGLPSLGATLRFSGDIAFSDMTSEAATRELLRVQNTLVNARGMLALSAGGVAPKSIVFTSTQPAEGKSSTAVLLARAASGAGRVLLIDGDMRRRALSKRLGFKGQRGFIHVLLGDEPLDSLLKTHPAMPDVDILPAGRSSRNPADALTYGRLDDMLAMARDTYSLVIIDAPPATVAADALIMAQKTDAAIYVVKLGVTRKRLALEAIGDFAKGGARSLGILGTHAKRGGAAYDYDYN